MSLAKSIYFIDIPKRARSPTPEKNRKLARQRISKRLNPYPTNLLKRTLTKASKFAEKNAPSKSVTKPSTVDKTCPNSLSEPATKTSQKIDDNKSSTQDKSVTRRTVTTRHSPPKLDPFLSRVFEVTIKYQEDLVALKKKIEALTQLNANPAVIQAEKLRKKAHKKMITIMRGFIGTSH